MRQQKMQKFYCLTKTQENQLEKLRPVSYSFGYFQMACSRNSFNYLHIAFGSDLPVFLLPSVSNILHDANVIYNIKKRLAPYSALCLSTPILMS